MATLKAPTLYLSLALWLAVLCVNTTLHAHAATLQVVDGDQQPVVDAVIQIYQADAPLQSRSESESEPEAARGQHEIAQERQAFIPRVSVVQRNTDISFPNRDNYSHHVYSFSKPRPFQLELYKGNIHAPLNFDTAGIVQLACNIHDSMRGFVIVTDAPWYGKTDETGALALEVPTGEYRVTVWHARQKSALETTLSIGASTIAPEAKLEIDLRPTKVKRRGLKAWADKPSGKSQ